VRALLDILFEFISQSIPEIHPLKFPWHSKESTEHGQVWLERTHQSKRPRNWRLRQRIAMCCPPATEPEDDLPNDPGFNSMPERGRLVIAARFCATCGAHGIPSIGRVNSQRYPTVCFLHAISGIKEPMKL
jgi:hypothetical protein